MVWLKKDVRLHDHAPLAAAAAGGRRFTVLYIYEPGERVDQHPFIGGVAASFMMCFFDRTSHRLDRAPRSAPRPLSPLRRRMVQTNSGTRRCTVRT